MRRALLVVIALLLMLASATASQSMSVARVTGQVMDETGQFLVSMILVEDLATNTRRTHFTDLTGRFALELPKGEYHLTFQQGSQYEKVETTINITSRIPKDLKAIVLTRLYHLSARGWYGGDLHQHTFFSDGADSPLALLTAGLAAGLDFGVVTDHNQVTGQAEYMEFSCLRNGSDSFLALGGVEVTSEDKGHYNVINTSKVYPFTFVSAEDFAISVDEAKGKERFVQVNHPSRRDILGFAYWEIIDRFDGIEVWNGKDIPPLSSTNLSAKEKWFELLNEGIRLTATASSDVHSVIGNSLRKDLDPLTLAWYTRGTFVGMPRTYVKLPELTASALVQALKEGKVFLSNGPLVIADISGKAYGEAVPPGDRKLSYEILNNEALRLLRMYINGKAVQEIPLEGLTAFGHIDLTLSAGQHVVLEVEAENLGYALTNPIYCE
jgi:hypothetical protein